MVKCTRIRESERWFDGQLPHANEIEQHTKKCAECAAHLAGLKKLRDGVQRIVRREEISDAQIPGFLAGVRERVEAEPPYRRRSAWAFASIAAAALIAALSAFILLTDGLGTVDATVVESYSTELEGASISLSASKNGVTTVWITNAKDDVW